MSNSSRRAGFSILELVIFLAALIVLAAIAAPRLIRTVERDRDPVALQVVDSAAPTVMAGSSEEIAVRVVDNRGEGVRGRRVDLVSSAASDSLTPARPVTDSAGIARVTWRFGADSGSRTLRILVPSADLETRLATTVEASPAPDTSAAPQPE